MGGTVGHDAPVVARGGGMDHRVGTDPLDQVAHRVRVADVEPFAYRRAGRAEVGAADGPARDGGAFGHARTHMAGGPGDEDPSDHGSPYLRPGREAVGVAPALPER
jgi:hypothetical protein